jgi:hydroxyethylthiazole kinase
MIEPAKLWQHRRQVCDKKPLVVNITNNVVTNFTANVLLAAGASPIMSEGEQEAAELAKIADAIVLNIGTLHPRQVEYFLQVGRYGNQNNKPVVFDPVGVGATTYRNTVAEKIFADLDLALIRGNCGEINFLSGIAGQVKGVDSIGNEIDIAPIKNFAVQQGTLLAATGEVDYITDGEMVLANSTGHVLLQSVTGTGCALSSLCGAFLAVSEDKLSGVLAAIAFYGAAAQKAAQGSTGPGSFAVCFLDALYNLQEQEFAAYLQQKPPRYC